MNVARPFKGGWEVLAASVRGASHIRTEIVCQDAHAWDILPEDVVIVAVADGAGSASLADTGSRIASECAVGVPRLWLMGPNAHRLEGDDDYRTLLKKAAVEAQKALSNEANSRNVDVHELATTLILVVATPSLIAAIQVGDGAAVALDALGAMVSITRPQFGEYINETTFLTSSNAVETAQVNIWRGAVGQIAVFSDGLQILALNMPEGDPYTGFFFPVFGFHGEMTDPVEAQAELEAFLASSAVRERTDDDVTLLLAKLSRS